MAKFYVHISPILSCQVTYVCVYGACSIAGNFRMALFSKILKMLDIFKNIFLKLLGSYYSYINDVTMFQKYFFEIIFTDDFSKI